MSIHGDRRATEAVASLADDSLAIEIIVVNTGAGSLRPALHHVLDHIVLVEGSTPRLPGGTRNLGLAEAHGPVIAFLAADCLATPGWAAQRLDAHRTALAVASAILPAPAADGSIRLASWAVHMLVHGRRDPDYPGAGTVRYGVSYRREAFAHHGAFLEDRLTNEDTEFNDRLPAPPAWAPSVVTLHRNPTTLRAALTDSFRRGGHLHGWMREQSSHATLRAMRRIAGALFYALSMIVRLPAHRRGTLVAAAPLACGLALAQAAGVLSQVGRRSGDEAAPPPVTAG